ncbi:MAG: hypothetical protein M3Z29_08095 [Pseudomonadota bacterium]|nr:hypothetical protein [Pseudomonadota bacterium]
MTIFHSVRKIGALLCLLLLGLQSADLAAQTRPTRLDAGGEPVRSLLWVGNSFFYYNNSMHGHYNELAKAGDPGASYRGVSVTISGSGLDWHDVASYLQPDGIGKYSFVADNKIVFNPPGRQFDAVIMMDCSQCPIHPQLSGSFRDTVKKDAAIVAKYGARPVLFMSWAYKDKPEMTAQLAEQYTLAGNANDALVVPAGLAFAKAIARRPELELYQPDKRHPTLAGTYLAACTTYAAILKKSPVGLKYTGGLDAELAAFLQTVAADTVQEYYRR